MSLLNKDRITNLFNDNEDSQNRRRSLFITVSIVSVITLLFTIFGFVTPLPLPAEEGQFVLVGYEDGEEDIIEPIEEPVEEENENTEEPEEITEPEEPVEPIETEAPAENEMQTSDEADAPEIDATETPVEPIETETPTVPIEEPVETPKEKDFSDFASALKSKPKPKGEEVETERELGEVGFKYNKTSFGSIGVEAGTGVDLVDMPPIEEKTQENADVYIT
ncbi:MAG: hypothetical protein ACPGLV_01800, partial [Bacteroidia bacterium]